MSRKGKQKAARAEQLRQANLERQAQKQHDLEQDRISERMDAGDMLGAAAALLDATPQPAETAVPFRMVPHRPTGHTKLDFEFVADAGDQCSNYLIHYPGGMDVKALFDAIRKERPTEHGTVSITYGQLPAKTALTYEYSEGMFTRVEKPGKNRKNFPVLSEILDRPVHKLTARGDWGRMDYFANIGDGAGLGLYPDPAEIRPYDQSEIKLEGMD